jgi:hypothetical protein
MEAPTAQHRDAAIVPPKRIAIHAQGGKPKRRSTSVATAFQVHHVRAAMRAVADATTVTRTRFCI